MCKLPRMAISTFLAVNKALPPRALPLALAVAWLILFGATFADLWTRWVRWDGDLAHGIPTMALFFYLLWKTGAWPTQSILTPVTERAVTAVLLVSASLLWFLAFAVNLQIIEQLLLLPILILAYGFIYGWRTILRHRILLVFPIFAIPIWGSLNGVLLEGASLVVGELVRLAGMPAVIQGNSIYIPFGHILIADGCSGLRYFVVALTVAYLIGYLNGYREGKLLVILAVAAVLALITNWIRIFLLIVIGYKTQMESSLMADHEMFGWILFGVIFLPAIYFAPVVRQSAGSDQESKPSIKSTAILGALGVMALGPLLGLILQVVFERSVFETDSVVDLTEAEPELRLPVEVRAPAGGATSAQMLSDRVFWRNDVYRREQLNQKLVPYLPRLYNHEHWLSPIDEMRTVGPHKVRYQVFSGKGNTGRVAQLQWFNVGGYHTASSVQAKLWQVPATLRGQNHFAIVTLQAQCDARDCAGAEAVLYEAAQQVLE